MPQKKAYQAILGSKCPKCREGQMFKHPLTRIDKFTAMNENCSQCGLRFEVEPGFFFGAMYISYAVTVGILVLTGITLNIISNGVYLSTFISSAIAITLILLPLTFRYSRVLFLYWFGGVKYKPRSS